MVVDGSNCAAGPAVVEADLTVAPFLTALTTLQVLPPVVTPAGVSAFPANEVETGNTPGSGDSNVYTVFYVETNPVYAEQPVEISSPQLESRCVRGWRFEPGVGAPVNQASGTSKAMGILDDDGNAVFVFKGVSCAAGPSAVIADVLAGNHPTYVTTYTVGAPVATVAGANKTKAHGQPKPHPKKHHGGGSGSGSGSGGSPAPMTVTASPNPLVETGLPPTGLPATLTITKTDDKGGSSVTGTIGDISAHDNLRYTITVTNNSSTTLNAMNVDDPLSSNPYIDSDSWTVSSTGGATGFALSGSGDIIDVGNLPPHASVTYTVDATPSCSAFVGTTISNTAKAIVTGLTVSATDSDLVVTNNC